MGPPRPDGSRNRRHVSGPTRMVVAAKLRDLEREREATRAAAREPMTVATWMEYWLTNIASARVRPRTLEGYRSITRRHIAPSIGSKPLTALRPEDVEQLYATLTKSGLSGSSLLRVHRVLSRAMKIAMQRQHVDRDVTRLVEPPPQRRSNVALPLTLEEARRVLAVAASERNAARWSVALALGLRQSEALALRWSDVDLDHESLTIRRTVHRVKGLGLVYDEPKSESSRRTLALPPELTDAIVRHKSQQREEQAAAGDAWHDNDLLFAQPNGLPIDRHTDYMVWRRLLDTAGVGPRRLHDARHTAATLLLAEGVHPRVVMDLLGHSQMRTTMDIYSHVMPALAREAAQRMGRTLLAEDAPAPLAMSGR
jgi:integrase